MAPPAAISSLFVPQIVAPQAQPESKTNLEAVNVHCPGLSNKALASWLHREQKCHLNLIQAAWALCLRSYTGSEDVWFSCLGPER